MPKRVEDNQPTTRSSQRWQSRPGYFDTLNASHLFPSDNALGIPSLNHTPIVRIPQWLTPYRTRIRSTHSLSDGGVHFFLDDYRFESVWHYPCKALKALKPYRIVLTPDFSLYRNWPLTLQIWNTYRNRWCGAFWQAHGLTVLPTISWSTAESFDFCFLGVPMQSVVAIGTIGLPLHKPLEKQLFLDGFSELVRRLRPSRVLCYGRIPSVCHEMAEIITYPTRWEGIVKAREKGARAHGRSREA